MRIAEVMDINKRTMGIVMRTDDMTEVMIKQLEKEGKLKDMKKEEKQVIARRRLVDHCMSTELGIDKEEWSKCKIKKIHNEIKNDKDGKKREVMYVQMNSIDDVNKVKMKLQDFEQELNNRIIPYNHPKSYERFRKLDQYAYEIRKRGQQTKIYNGKYDYKLIVRNRGDKTKWSEIPPIVNPMDLPELRVGKLSEEDKKMDELNKLERREKAKERKEKIEKGKNKEKEETEKEVEKIIRETDQWDLKMS